MSKILFSKYSNERAGRFALRTDIIEEGRMRQVRKTAMYPEGEAHIRNIERWYRELEHRYKGTEIHLNRCTLENDHVLLEYLEGDTLEHVLDRYLSAGETDRLVETLFAYLDEVKKGFTRDTFVVTPEFEEVFGSAVLPENLLCGDVADIDMVLNNVVIYQGMTLIDYEWTFDFPIPYHFVVYRILTYYLNGSASRACLREKKLYEKAGITEAELEIYERMEFYFQAIYVVSEGRGGEYHVPVRDLLEELYAGAEDQTSSRFQKQKERLERMVQIYQAPDPEFREEGSERREPVKEGKVREKILVNRDSKYVRLDPCSKYCIVRDLKLYWGREIRPLQANGIVGEDKSLFFPVEDPQIIIKRPKDAPDILEVSFEAEYLDEASAFRLLREQYALQNRSLGETTQKLRQKEALIHEMENTKVWKAYRKLKRN